MAKQKISHKQQMYAYNRMNTNLNKGDSARLAGYSENMAKQPSVIEQSDGFKLAMAGIFGRAGNVAMTLLNEIQTRDVSKETTKNLVNFFDVMTRAMERIAPKETKQDDNVIKAFANIIDITPIENHAEQAENTPIFKDETTSTIDNNQDVLHDDSIV
jgi:hypothetical protein